MEFEWREEGWEEKPPTAVITFQVDGKDYIMDLLTYNENIEKGKTKFVTLGDKIHMVTEDELELLKAALKKVKE